MTHAQLRAAAFWARPTGHPGKLMPPRHQPRPASSTWLELGCLPLFKDARTQSKPGALIQALSTAGIRLRAALKEREGEGSQASATDGNWVPAARGCRGVRQCRVVVLVVTQRSDRHKFVSSPRTMQSRTQRR